MTPHSSLTMSVLERVIRCSALRLRRRDLLRLTKKRLLLSDSVYDFLACSIRELKDGSIK